MKRVQRYRIAVMVTAGTRLGSGRFGLVRSVRDLEDWVERFQELQVIAELRAVFVPLPESQRSATSIWLALAQTIRSILSSVDGVVVLQDFATLHYTAHALSLMLRRLPVPVVVAGLDGTVPPTDAGQRVNIINALQVAAADVAEVCVVSGNRILRGSRVQPALHDGVVQFTTPDAFLLGRVDFGTKLFPGRLTRGSRRPIWNIHLDPNVLITTVTPGVSTASLRQALHSHIRGLVLQLTDPTGIPPEIMQLLEQARGVTIVLSSNVMIKDRPRTFVPLAACTPSMAVVKTMWALGGASSPAAVRNTLLQEVVGEFSRSGGAT